MSLLIRLVVVFGLIIAVDDREASAEGDTLWSLSESQYSASLEQGLSSNRDGIVLRIHPSKTAQVATDFFVLEKPTRLVLDVSDLRSSNSVTQVPYGNDLVTAIRVGKHKEKTRFVLEMRSPSVPQYELQQNGRSLELWVGEFTHEHARASLGYGTLQKVPQYPVQRMEYDFVVQGIPSSEPGIAQVKVTNSGSRTLYFAIFLQEKRGGGSLPSGAFAVSPRKFRLAAGASKIAQISSSSALLNDREKIVCGVVPYDSLLRQDALRSIHPKPDPKRLLRKDLAQWVALDFSSQVK